MEEEGKGRAKRGREGEGLSPPPNENPGYGLRRTFKCKADVTQVNNMVDNRIPVPATYIGTIAQYRVLWFYINLLSDLICCMCVESTSPGSD